MRTFPTRQNPLDWATQYWNIALGRKVTLKADEWLLGPIGGVNEDVHQFVKRIADENGLIIERNIPGSGLLDCMDQWAGSMKPRIREFYKHTLDFDLSVHTSWRPGFGGLGYLVARLFSRRIQQLHLPEQSHDTIAIESDFIRLIDANGSIRYTIWHRSIRDTSEVVFFGIYSTCRIPSGEVCIKVIFPLPCGSATVILRPQIDPEGNLALISSGKRDGDPGFYFLVKDVEGGLWKHYLSSLRERIIVSESDVGTLTAEHTLRLWSLPVYTMKYSIVERTDRHTQ